MQLYQGLKLPAESRLFLRSDGYKQFNQHLRRKLFDLIRFVFFYKQTLVSNYKKIHINHFSVLF